MVNMNHLSVCSAYIPFAANSFVVLHSTDHCLDVVLDSKFTFLSRMEVCEF